MKHLRSRRALAHAHTQRKLLSAHSTLDERFVPEVAARLKPRQIIKRDNSILVTEVGFVTMAINCDYATDTNGLLVVPGVDDSGQHGFLVQFEGTAPYHALADDVQHACEQALQSQQKARELNEAYGNKATMYREARKAPWSMMIREEDLVMSGMCVWGVDSWLRRFGLNRFRRFGLPSVLLKLAGFYGARVTACALLRVNGFTDNDGNDVRNAAIRNVNGG